MYVRRNCSPSSQRNGPNQPHTHVLIGQVETLEAALSLRFFPPLQQPLCSSRESCESQFILLLLLRVSNPVMEKTEPSSPHLRR